jgi:hypothetical protein
MCYIYTNCLTVPFILILWIFLYIHKFVMFCKIYMTRFNLLNRNPNFRPTFISTPFIKVLSTQIIVLRKYSVNITSSPEATYSHETRKWRECDRLTKIVRVTIIVKPARSKEKTFPFAIKGTNSKRKQPQFIHSQHERLTVTSHFLLRTQLCELTYTSICHHPHISARDHSQFET